MAPPLITKGGRTLPTKSKFTGPLPRIPRKPRVFKKGKLSSNRRLQPGHKLPPRFPTPKAAKIFPPADTVDGKTKDKKNAEVIADRTQVVLGGNLLEGVSKEELEGIYYRFDKIEREVLML
jgi:hypothetical protein